MNRPVRVLCVGRSFLSLVLLALFFSIPEIIVIALVLGVLVGLINGLLIPRLNVAPFIAKLGTLDIARGAALLVSNGATFPNLEARRFRNDGLLRHDLLSAGFDLAASLSP